MRTFSIYFLSDLHTIDCACCCNYKILLYFFWNKKGPKHSSIKRNHSRTYLTLKKIKNFFTHASSIFPLEQKNIFLLNWFCYLYLLDFVGWGSKCSVLWHYFVLGYKYSGHFLGHLSSLVASRRFWKSILPSCGPSRNFAKYFRFCHKLLRNHTSRN